jgi:hypothetical protein
VPLAPGQCALPLPYHAYHAGLEPGLARLCLLRQGQLMALCSVTMQLQCCMRWQASEMLVHVSWTVKGTIWEMQQVA